MTFLQFLFFLSSTPDNYMFIFYEFGFSLGSAREII